MSATATPVSHKRKRIGMRQLAAPSFVRRRKFERRGIREPGARSGVDGDRAGLSISKAICVTASVLSVSGGAVAETYEKCVTDAELRQGLGARAVEGIDAAERVEIARVEPGHLDSAKDAPPNVAGFPLIGAFQPLGGELPGAGFRRTLLGRKTYEFAPPGAVSEPACGGFQPGVALRFGPKGKGRPVEVLVCFNCSELAIVSGAAPFTMVSFEPGRLDILRLVAAAVPDLPNLATMLAAEQADLARELMFASMFRPDVLVAFDHVASGRPDATAAAVIQLRRHVSGKALFVLASRALGVKGNDLHRLDGATKALYAAVRPLTSAETIAGLEAIRGDQVALAGAAELLAKSGVARELPEPTRVVLGAPAPGGVPGPERERAVRGDSDGRQPRRQAARAAARPHPARAGRRRLVDVPVLPPRRAVGRRVRAHGPRRHRRGRGARRARDLEAGDAARYARRARGARAARRGEDALDGTLLATESPTVAAVTLDGIVAHPSRRSLDVLAENGLDATTGVRGDGERVFEALTGAKVSNPEDGYRARAAELRAWWASHRDAWQPRSGASPPDAGAP